MICSSVFPIRSWLIVTVAGAVAALSVPHASADASTTQVFRKGSPPVTAGPAENFVGAVKVESPYQGTGGSRIRGSTVTFEPGARSNWHRHPMGQALVVTEGCGWTQAEGGSIEKICAGDVAWIGPGEKIIGMARRPQHR